jgi:ParB family transcriptional regulator, chromosome partitioning protein
MGKVGPLRDVKRDGVLSGLFSLDDLVISDIIDIPIDKIKYHPKNKFGMRDIEKLAESIKDVGLLHNIVVRKIVDPVYEYEMLSGERRLRALMMLNEKAPGNDIYKKIKSMVLEVNDLTAEKILIIANIETRELTEMEKSDSVKRLYEIVEQERRAGKDFKGKKTKEIVADMMSREGNNVAATTVGKLVKLQELIEEFKPFVESGEMSRETAYQYAQMTKGQQRLVYDAFEKRMLLTAKDAKELKERLKKQEGTNEEIIEAYKAEIEKIKKEAQKYSEKLNETDFKKNIIEKQLHEKEIAFNYLNHKYNKMLDDMDKA